jgi:hypothetical protein
LFNFRRFEEDWVVWVEEVKETELRSFETLIGSSGVEGSAVVRILDFAVGTGK